MTLYFYFCIQYSVSSVQLLSHVRLFATPWTTARQASLSIINSQSLLKLMSIESVMPSNHLTLCCPLLLLPSIFPSIRVFSNESALRIKWPKYWSFNFSTTKTLVSLCHHRVDPLIPFCIPKPSPLIIAALFSVPMCLILFVQLFVF